MTIILYLLAIFISLFILYAISRHDFVLLRQSISLRQVFDTVFISLFVFFMTSRIFYILYAQAFDLFNPLKFFYLPKHWGILPYAGLIGIIAAIFFMYRKKKNKLRILDLYFISFTPIILLDVLLRSNGVIMLAIKAVSVIVLIMFYGWFIKIHNKFTTKDGFITIMTIITYSLVSLAFSLASNGIFSQKYVWFNIMLLVVTVISSILLFLIQRDTFNKQ